MTAKTDRFENQISDFLWRGQPLVIGGATATWSTAPTYYIGLLTGAPSDSSAGTEVSGTGYARVAITASLTAFSGTQTPGSTTASTGTDGTIENNAVLSFARPDTTANWGSVGWFGIYDAASGGNLLEYAVVNGGTPVAIGPGVSTVQFAAGSLSLQEDN